MATASSQEFYKNVRGFMKLCMEAHDNYDLSPTDTVGTFEGRIYHSFDEQNYLPFRIYEFVLTIGNELLPTVVFKKQLFHPFIFYGERVLCIVQEKSRNSYNPEAIMEDIINTFTLKPSFLNKDKISPANVDAVRKFKLDDGKKLTPVYVDLRDAGIIKSKA